MSGEKRFPPRPQAPERHTPKRLLLALGAGLAIIGAWDFFKNPDPDHGQQKEQRLTDKQLNDLRRVRDTATKILDTTAPITRNTEAFNEPEINLRNYGPTLDDLREYVGKQLGYNEEDDDHFSSRRLWYILKEKNLVDAYQDFVNTLTINNDDNYIEIYSADDENFYLSAELTYNEADEPVIEIYDEDFGDTTIIPVELQNTSNLKYQLIDELQCVIIKYAAEKENQKNNQN